MRIILIYAVSWLGLAVLAILNGASREKFYGRYMRELSAHQLSTFIALVLFGIYIWLLSGLFRIESPKQALMIGGMWFIMTILFEFVFGRFVVGHTWDRLLQDYNLINGRVWLFVLAWTTTTPYIFYLIRN